MSNNTDLPKLPRRDGCMLPDFTTWYEYENTHLVMAFSASLAGICGHALLIIVLTRRTLFNPTNQLLCTLSVMQSILLLSYCGFNMTNYLAEIQCDPTFWSFSWATFAHVVNTTQAFAQTAAQWIVVVVCVLRCIAATSYSREHFTWLTHKTASWCIVLVLCLTVVICLPVSLWAEVFQRQYVLGRSTRFGEHVLYMRVTSLIYLIFGKVLPMCITVVISGVLLYRLRVLQQKTSRLCSTSIRCPTPSTPGNRAENGDKASNGRISVGQSQIALLQQQTSTVSGNTLNSQLNRRLNCSRTRSWRLATHLIVLMMGSFVMFEAPQSIVLLYTETFSTVYDLLKCYRNLIEMFEMCTIMCSSINFILFCATSSQFRSEFLCMLKGLISCIFIRKRSVESAQTTRCRSLVLNNNNNNSTATLPFRDSPSVLSRRTTFIQGHAETQSIECRLGSTIREETETRSAKIAISPQPKVNLKRCRSDSVVESGIDDVLL